MIHLHLYFYPRSPCGERRCSLRHSAQVWHFYPRSPCGERQTRNFLICLSFLYFYPRSPCGERRYLINTYHRIFGISIHALLAESDITGLGVGLYLVTFLSTLSLRRATAQVCQVVSAELYFYPRSPCGERLDYHVI